MAQSSLEDMQEQIAALQAEYMADPSPEALIKMQSAIQELATAQILDQMAAIASNDDDDDEGFSLYGIDEGMSDEELADFIENYAPPAGKEKYMPIGATLITQDDEPFQTLMLTGDEEDYTDGISEVWSVDDHDSAIEKLTWLMEEGHSARFGEKFANYLKDAKPTLTRSSLEGYTQTLAILEQVDPALFELAERCTTMRGWDLERVGYLARIFAYIEYITDDEAWDWFEKAAAEVKSTFESWDEYIASVLVGRGIAIDCATSVIGAAEYMLDEGRAYLDAHPISAL
jgi:hypothetical protein